MVSPGGSQPVSAERRLQDLGIVLPNAPHPLGAYVEAVQSGNLLFLSGMLPVKDGKLQYVGRLGKELDADRWPGCITNCDPECSFCCEGASRVTGPRDEGCQREESTWQQTETFTTSLSLRTRHRSFSAMYLERTRCPCGPSSEWPPCLSVRRSCLR